MSALTMANRNLLSPFSRSLFGNGGMLNPRIWDFEGDLFDMDFTTQVPSVNILESDKEFKFHMAVPGMEKKDFKVSLDQGMLTISAEKKEEKKEEKENYARKEYSFNSFSRSFRLPDNCLPDKMEAKYENGILMLMLPKKEVTITKAIKEIKVA